MRKIAINLETQKRNASRSLPVRTLQIPSAETNFSSEKNFEVENFQLLTIFSENFLSVEICLEWKWVLIFQNGCKCH